MKHVFEKLNKTGNLFFNPVTQLHILKLVYLTIIRTILKLVKLTMTKTDIIGNQFFF